MKHKPIFQKFIIVFVIIIVAAIFLMIYFRIGAQRSATKNGSVIREYHRADGSTWQGTPATEEFRLPSTFPNR